MTKVRVQLQTGTNNIHSIAHGRDGLTYLEVAMMLHQLFEVTAPGFSAAEQKKYQDAITGLRGDLHRAMLQNFTKTHGNQFRGNFRARYKGKEAQYRVDVEVLQGRLSPS
jgi:hypothetical protein